MLKIKVIATGAERDKNIKALASEFVKRTGRWAKVEIIFVPEFAPQNQNAIAASVKRESEAQLKNIEGFVFALDSHGEQLKSEEFASKIDKISQSFSTITFIIGGSCGLDNSVKTRADALLSFGKMTLPHELARLVLVEQVYRAFTILSNLPYHK